MRWRKGWKSMKSGSEQWPSLRKVGQSMFKLFHFKPSPSPRPLIPWPMSVFAHKKQKKDQELPAVRGWLMVLSCPRLLLSHVGQWTNLRTNPWPRDSSSHRKACFASYVQPHGPHYTIARKRCHKSRSESLKIKKRSKHTPKSFYERLNIYSITDN